MPQSRPSSAWLAAAIAFLRSWFQAARQSRSAAAAARRLEQELKDQKRLHVREQRETRNEAEEDRRALNGAQATVEQLEDELAESNRERSRLEAKVDLLELQLEEVVTWREKWLEWMRADIAVSAGRRSLAYEQPGDDSDE